MSATDTSDARGQGGSHIHTDSAPVFESPNPSDGADLWRLARDSKTLDLNSPYTYLLCASHFADTSVVARVDGRTAGFVFGYLRPDSPDTVFVWQVAVDDAYRGRRLGVGMLQALADRLQPLGCRYLECSVTPDNTASTALFGAFARSRKAPMVNDRVLFTAAMFPPAESNPTAPDTNSHQEEVLFRIGPFSS
ncbi:MAG: diaminobutyrate acetyltransferase [Micromonosporaceae bacterium]